MKPLYLLFTFQILIVNLLAQEIIIDSIAELPSQIEESSGLIFYNNKLITHTDSGESALYEIDENNSQIDRIVYIKNVTNADWEDITQDQDYIYIGNFGNNNGNRTDLEIIKIDKLEYSSQDSVEPEFIKFSYEDQIDFTSTNFTTNFDAEALISYKDSLYVFTKNWGNKETNIYSIPKETGTFIAKKLANYDTECMITGASYNPNTNKIVLCAYTIGFPFLFELKGFSGSDFFGESVKKFSVLNKGSFQIESVCYKNDVKYYMSSEKFYNSNPVLQSFTLEYANNVSKVDIGFNIYPNPTNSNIYVDTEFDEINIYNYQMQFIKNVTKNNIELKNESNGIYFLEIFKNKQRIIVKVEKY